MTRAGGTGGGAQPSQGPRRAVTVISTLDWKSSSERNSSWSTATQLVHGGAKTHTHISNSQARKRGLRTLLPNHPDPKQGNAWAQRPLAGRAPGPAFTVLRGRSAQSGQAPRDHTVGTLAPPPGSASTHCVSGAAPSLRSRRARCPGGAPPP